MSLIQSQEISIEMTSKIISLVMTLTGVIGFVGIVFYTIQNQNMIGDIHTMNIAIGFVLVAGIGIVMAKIHQYIKN